MKRTMVLFLAALAAGLAFATPDASAQGSGTLRLGVMQCPDGYSGVNYSADCVEPATGIEFTIASPNTGNIATGVSSEFEPISFELSQFDLNPEGADTVSIGEPATYAGDYYATCATAQEPMPVNFQTIETGAGTLYGITIEFDGADDIVCNWYRTFDAAADEPDPSEDAVVQLPATGAGPLALASFWR